MKDLKGFRYLSLFVVTGLIASSANTSPLATNVDACFSSQSQLPVYLEAIRHSGEEPFSIANALESSCAELEDPNLGLTSYFFRTTSPTYLTKIEKIAANIGFNVAAGPFFEIPTIISTHYFKDGENLKRYREALAKIQLTQNRFERIREVYDLALSEQGEYDNVGYAQFMKYKSIFAKAKAIFTDPVERAGYVKMFKELGETPGGILDRKEKTGIGGVCRDFALLLEWSLMQVNLSPTLPKNIRKWGGLDNDSFMARTVSNGGAATPKSDVSEGGHVWVEVVLPFRFGSNVEFARMDLDPTFYHDYTTIYPRLDQLNLHDLNYLHDQCQRVKCCVAREGSVFISSCK